jgi:hypothetical protein
MTAYQMNLISNFLPDPSCWTVDHLFIQKHYVMPLVCLSVILSVCLLVCLFFCQSVVCSHLLLQSLLPVLSVAFLSTSLSACRLACLSFCHAASLPVCHPVQPSIGLSGFLQSVVCSNFSHKVPSTISAVLTTFISVCHLPCLTSVTPLDCLPFTMPIRLLVCLSFCQSVVCFHLSFTVPSTFLVCCSPA